MNARPALPSGDYEIAVIGASWGGLSAVTTVLASLPPDLDAVVVVAQHRSTDHDDGGLVRTLNRRSGLPVVEASDKEPLEPGRAYLAPADYHVLIEVGQASLSVDRPEQYSRPSIDVLFESAADAYGARAVGVVLTGANRDGAAGLARMRASGGLAIVEDPTTAERPEMPLAALAEAGADRVLPVESIGPFLSELCGRRAHANH